MTSFNDVAFTMISLYDVTFTMIGRIYTETNSSSETKSSSEQLFSPTI